MNGFPRYTVDFYKTPGGNEPVREWLKALPSEWRRIIGEDLKTVQFGFPLGMLLVRKMEADVWEVHSTLPDGIARVLFTVQGRRIVLLHAFIKKSQKTPQNELAVARKRLADLLS
jgi:phage-related protein